MGEEEVVEVNNEGLASNYGGDCVGCSEDDSVEDKENYGVVHLA